jgi:hypothetical protein
VGDKTVVEERWTVGPDNRLSGSSWALHPGAPGGVIEALVIVDTPDGPTMRIRHFDATLEHAREEKDQPMAFVADRCDPNSMSLAGQGSRTGERLTYTRDGDSLKFVGDFIHEGKPIRAEETFERMGD